MPYSKNNTRTVLKFHPRRTRSRQEPVIENPRSPVRLSRLMALAIRFEDLLRSGEVENYSELASRYGVDRGRISHIMHLRLLAPILQKRLLDLKESKMSLKHVLPICKVACWEEQIEKHTDLKS